MDALMVLRRSGVAMALGVAFASLIVAHGYAQGVGVSIDAAAGLRTAPAYPAHLLPARPGPNTDPQDAVEFNKASHEAAISNEAAIVNGGSPPPGGYYPGDVSNSKGGPTIHAATQHMIFLGCGSGSSNRDTCWGSPDPRTFETNLSKSGFINLLNQYTGVTTANRYPVAGEYCYNNGSVGNYLSWTQILSWVSSCYKNVFKVGGTGNFYHLFLNKGIDTCQSNNTSCYSPDGAHGTFAFCGYHTYTTINNVLVFFTVEPYQAVNGCYGAANDTGFNLVEATSNVLSHETFELISDPEINAWIGGNTLNSGQEIGDECVWQLYKVNISGTTYALQLEYSNTYHACTVS